MNSFEYLQPNSLSSASKTNLKHPKSSYLYAGGTDLLGLLKDELISPKTFINLKSVKSDSLKSIIEDNDGNIIIGSLTKIYDIAKNPIVKKYFNALSQSAEKVATPQLRNVATIGGNLCQRPRCAYFRGDFNCLRKHGNECYAFSGHNKYHAIIGGGPCYIVHPSDIAVALIALNASIVINTNSKEKQIKLQDFFILPEIDYTKENILQPGDILTKIIIPKSAKQFKSGYIKIMERGAWDFALVNIAGSFKINGNKIKEAKIVFGGVAPIPYLDENLNRRLQNLSLTENEITRISEIALQDAEPLEMNNYKVRLAKNLVRKLLLNLKNN